ncbi:unnamed protein product [Mucor hiemalis]
MTFYAETIYMSFYASVQEAGSLTSNSLASRKYRRLSRRLRCPPTSATTGVVIEEDVVMTYAGPTTTSSITEEQARWVKRRFSSSPFSSPPKKCARLSSSASLHTTTSSSTTAVWCASDFDRKVKKEKKKVLCFLGNPTTIPGYGLFSFRAWSTTPAHNKKRSFGDVL